MSRSGRCLGVALLLGGCAGSPDVAPAPAAATAAELTDAELTDAEPAAAPLPALPLEVPEAHRCEVAMLEVLSDAAKRGYPNTAEQQAWAAGLDPTSKALYQSEEHGSSYRECRYAVSVGGLRYAFTLTWDTTWQPLPEGWCARAADHAVAQVQRVTLGCTALHRGAAWGQDLVTLASPSP